MQVAEKSSSSILAAEYRTDERAAVVEIVAGKRWRRYSTECRQRMGMTSKGTAGKGWCGHRSGQDCRVASEAWSRVCAGRCEAMRVSAERGARERFGGYRPGVPRKCRCIIGPRSCNGMAVGT